MRYLILLIFIFSNVVKADWEALSFNKGEFNLPYQLYTPSDLTEEKVPLFIYLHGSGEAGTDNKLQMYPGNSVGPSYFSRSYRQNMQKTYILAPQTPKDMRWANTSLAPYDFDKTPITLSMDALLSLIDKLIIDKKIDSNRIYLAGLSRGGQGVWNAALHRPDFFAAIAPIAGSSSVKHAKRLIHLPIWAFHGNNDDVTKVDYTRAMIDAIYKAGGTSSKVRYTEIEQGDHPSSWLRAHDSDELWNWFLSHSK